MPIKDVLGSRLCSIGLVGWIVVSCGLGTSATHSPIQLRLEETYAVRAGDTVEVRYEPPVDDANAGILEDLAGADLAGFTVYPENASSGRAPTFGTPTFVDSGHSLSIELVTGDLDSSQNGPELEGRFSISQAASGANPIANAIASVNISVDTTGLSNTFLAFTLREDTLSQYKGQTLYINYSDPTTADDNGGVLQSTLGTDAESFSKSFAYNTTGAGDNAPPTLITNTETRVTSNSTGSQIILNFSEPLSTNVVGSSQFYFTDSIGTILPNTSVSSVTVNGSSLTLTLNSSLNSSTLQNLRLHYEPSAIFSEQLEDAAGNRVVSFDANIFDAIESTTTTPPAGGSEPQALTASNLSYSSLTNSITITAAGGSFKTMDQAGLLALQSKFSLSSSNTAGSSPITGAISSVNINGSGQAVIQLNAVALKDIPSGNLYLSYNDSSSTDDNSGVLEAAVDGSDYGNFFGLEVAYEPTDSANSQLVLGNATYESSSLKVQLPITSGFVNTNIDWAYLLQHFSLTAGASSENGGTHIANGITSFGFDPGTNALTFNLSSGALSSVQDQSTLYLNYTDPSSSDDSAGVLETLNGSDVNSFNRSFTFVASTAPTNLPIFGEASYESSSHKLQLPITSGELNTNIDWTQIIQNFSLTAGASEENGGTQIPGGITSFSFETGTNTLTVNLASGAVANVQDQSTLYLNYTDPSTSDDSTGVLQAINGTDVDSFNRAFTFFSAPFELPSFGFSITFDEPDNSAAAGGGASTTPVTIERSGNIPLPADQNLSLRTTFDGHPIWSAGELSQEQLNSVQSALDNLTITSTGSWTYRATVGGAQCPLDFLSKGERLTLKYQVNVSDVNGNNVGEDTIEVRINGTNDPPAPVADNGQVTEDSTLNVSAQLGLLSNDIDVDTPASGLRVDVIANPNQPASEIQVPADSSASISNDYGTLTVHSDGSYSFLADGSASQALANGQNQSTSFSYSVTDGENSSTPVSLTLEITGTNDSPVVSSFATNVITGAVAELADGSADEVTTSLTSNGSFSVDDLDLSDSLSVSIPSATSNADSNQLPSGQTTLGTLNTSISPSTNGSDSRQ